MADATSDHHGGRRVECGLQASELPLDVAHVQMGSAGNVSLGLELAVVADVAPLSVLVNNAGVIARRPAAELPDEDWSRVIETDLSGVFRCARAAFPLFIQNGGGAIVNVASIAATVGISGRVAYTSAKAGVEGLTRTLALEWAASGIRSTRWRPGGR